MNNKANLATVIALVAMMLAVGCGAQASAEQKGTNRFTDRFTDIKGSSVSYQSQEFTDRHTGCKYATLQDGGGRVVAAVPLYGTDGKPLGCGEVSK